MQINRTRARTRARIAAGMSAVLGAALVFEWSGCSPDSPLPAALLEQAESAGCGELSYQNFGADFFASYCLRCHNEQLVGDTARTDAPTGINYNTLSDIRVFQNRIRLRAGVQGDMPPRLLPVPRPSEAERQMLIEWIDCGLPASTPQ